MARAKIQAKPFRLPLMDLEDFKFYYKSLYTVFGSQRKAAHALDVSYSTYLKWEHNPPSWPYWPVVMEHVLRARLRGLRISRDESYTSDKYWRITQQLLKHSQHQGLTDAIEDQALEVLGAADHLRRSLSTKGMYWDEINANNRTRGYYSARALQKAAKKLGVIKTREGFGPDKRSYWRLPTLQTEEDDQ